MPPAVLAVVVVWPVVEVAVLVLLARLTGWPAALLLVLLLSVLGVVVIRASIRRAKRGMQAMDARRIGTPGTGAAAAHATLRVLGGLLLLLPGLVSGLLGLLLLVPVVRTLTLALAGQAAVRRLPSLNAAVTRLRIWQPAGPVVEGRVVANDEPPTRPPDALPPSR